MNNQATIKKRIKEAARKIVERVHPEKIILFGSYAWGKPHRDSDVDLFVVMRSKKSPTKRAIDVSMALEPRSFPVDILVRTPAEIRKRIEMGDFFIKNIVEKGRTLYAK